MQGQIPPPLSGNYATRELSGIPGWIIEMRSLLARDTRTRWAGPVAAVTTAATVGLVHDTILWTDALRPLPLFILMGLIAVWRSAGPLWRRGHRGAGSTEPTDAPTMALWAARATALGFGMLAAGASKQDAVGDPRSALWVRSGPW